MAKRPREGEKTHREDAVSTERQLRQLSQSLAEVGSVLIEMQLRIDQLMRKNAHFEAKIDAIERAHS